MTEEEEMYRLMNEEDPWYMGPESEDSEDSDDEEDREYNRTSDKRKKSR